MLRVCLISTSRDKHVLWVSLPSVCGDSRTVINLIRQAAASIGSSVASEDFKDEILQYADYAEWLREVLESDDVEFRNERASGLSSK